MNIPRPLFRGQTLGCSLVVAVASSVMIGCGDSEELGQITGTVTVNGEAVTHGSIVYENRGQSISVRTNLDDAGQYHVRTHDRDGLPPGTYQVAVSSTRIGSGDSPFVGGRSEKALPPTGPAIPKVYSKVGTSQLSAEIEVGKNVKDFDLE